MPPCASLTLPRIQQTIVATTHPLLVGAVVAALAGCSLIPRGPVARDVPATVIANLSPSNLVVHAHEDFEDSNHPGDRYFPVIPSRTVLVDTGGAYAAQYIEVLDSSCERLSIVAGDFTQGAKLVTSDGVHVSVDYGFNVSRDAPYEGGAQLEYWFAVCGAAVNNFDVGPQPGVEPIEVPTITP